MKNNAHLLLATSNCLAICEPDTIGWRVARRELMGNFTTSVLAVGEDILVGTQDGIYRSGDEGGSWRAVNNGLTSRHIRWLAAHPDLPERIFAGSEPAGIYVSLDGGNSWRGCPEVEEMRKTQGWYLPYSPEAGCVRGFGFDEARVYAAVEVGGVLLSEDNGDTWQLIQPSESSNGDIHPDVHSIAAHPGSLNLVAAATGGGFYSSTDGGRTWKNRYPNSYCRAFWWDETNPDHMLLGSADWVDRNGRVEQTLDGGDSWRSASQGLDVPWRTHMVERFVSVGGELLAVLSNGEVWISSLEELDWKRILPEVLDVKAASVIYLGDQAW
jgi:photosystem II stability/assembly factor-like uncharacterized protein